MNSFFEIIKERKEKRKEMEEALREAHEKLIEAEMLIGEGKVRSIAERIAREREVNSSKKNIMGVSIEEFELQDGEEPRYGFLTTNSSFDDAVRKARYAMEKIIEVASIESSIQRLGKEIEKTKRRVNALEHIFIPRIVATISYIERQLEEREREDFFRRKRIKALMKKHED